ncbi:OLC1v1029167C1 [Oldenlandia corymbosa var. corymbosa]|uniref:OLC1v1029167C1 n=1 Tax=Oldenlandia corymbosa var. corymbosa TaxID=529605 RepID=A0AAV1CDQ4_OLDCO|nr:OLC1v1029167C1 [Oldenlandia corymbosa var. corymbosa]
MAVKLIAFLLLVEMALFLLMGLAVLANDSQQGSTNTVDDNLQRPSAVIKTIQSEDGDIIDCVDIYKQPALSHPALRNHKIQMEPSFVPTIDQTTRKINRAKGKKNKPSKSEIPVSGIKQIWHKNGSCPQGTVPIRRNMQTNSKAFPISSRRFRGSFNRNKDEFNKNGTVNLLNKNHAQSILITVGHAYLGGQGGIAVFTPEVEKFDEYSLSDVTLVTGGHDDFEAIKSGWMVNPKVYGDRKTRFFTYWTADGGQKTGCFDSICPGFVQVSKDIALGAAIDLVSKTPNMPAELMTIIINKDVDTNNWWVSVNNQKVGYWPPDLFIELKYQAIGVQWGGDVYSTRLETHPHTATAMGSGEYSTPLDWIAGSIRGMRVLENSLVWKYPDVADPYTDQLDCYDFYLQLVADDPIFYYGGPGSGGKVSKCP